jgi:HEPN domain-containing protein
LGGWPILPRSTAAHSMKPPERVRHELVRQWAAKADGDYLAAEQLLKAPSPLRDIVAFHCQQAVEKYLKALLVQHAVEFPKTHNLKELLALLLPVLPELARALSDVSVLTPYGVEVRYPADFPEVLPGEETAAFDLATRTKDAVWRELKYIWREWEQTK